MFLEDLKGKLDRYLGMTSTWDGRKNELVYYSPTNIELFRLGLFSKRDGWHLCNMTHSLSGQMNTLFDLLDV